MVDKQVHLIKLLTASTKPLGTRIFHSKHEPDRKHLLWVLEKLHSNCKTNIRSLGAKDVLHRRLLEQGLQNDWCTQSPAVNRTSDNIAGWFARHLTQHNQQVNEQAASLAMAFTYMHDAAASAIHTCDAVGSL